VGQPQQGQAHRVVEIAIEIRPVNCRAGFSLLHVALALSSGRSCPSGRSRRKRRPIASHCRSSRNHSRSRGTDHQTRTRRNCGCGTCGGNDHGSGHGPMPCARPIPEHVRQSSALWPSGPHACGFRYITKSAMPAKHATPNKILTCPQCILLSYEILNLCCLAQMAARRFDARQATDRPRAIVAA
jgi:hypothetical protein